MDIDHASDLLDIQDVLVRYTQALDLGQPASLRDVFMPDGVIDARGFGGSQQSLSDLIEDTVRRTPPSLLPSRHLLGNTTCDIDGDVAHVFTDFTRDRYEEPKLDAEGAEYVRDTGFFEDEFVRDSAGWRIRVRKVFIKSTARFLVSIADRDSTFMLMEASRSALGGVR